MTPTFNLAYLTLIFSGFLCLITLLRRGGTIDPAFCFAKASQVLLIGESSVRFVSGKFLVSVLLCAHDLVPGEVGFIDGVFHGVVRSELEGEI